MIGYPRAGITAAAIVAALLAAPLQAGTADVQEALANPERSEAERALDESRMPAEVIAFSGIEEGAVVADFMAGGGYYTALLARQVGPDGRVYAVNPAGFHDPKVWAPVLRDNANIRVMPVAPQAMLIAPGSVDTIFTHLVFHDLYWESEQYKFPRLDVDFVLANWFAAVKPGGSVIVVDHVGPAGDPRKITQSLHRIDPETVIAAMSRAGFTLEKRSDMLQRSEDDGAKNVFDPEIRGKTDRFVMKFRR
ncbi:methyltransferase [Altererythrobacter luteolus]|uniref:Methyltransferase n=1 Tax=Pontixanthobacter luteolus TaxID=295089 RepID=A0A6I4V8E1_9SPHN|nr:class I SAM-dependent methyltransferase [Pontixanthobacter luteolus]MXP48132.1 methyltransferase [Pontixanthobacter luteolus]